MKKGVHYIKAGWLFDGRGGKPEQSVLLEITDGKFTNVEVAANIDGIAPGNVTDLSHCSILPPFVDSHVHLSMSGTLDQKRRKEQLKADYDSVCPVISRHVSEQLLHGVVAVRDGGDRLGAVLRYKMSLQDTTCPHLIVRSPGRAWHQKGRYGKLIGRFPGDEELLYKAVRRESDSTDHLKVVNSGLNSLKTYGHETKPQFGYHELEQTISQAEKSNLKVMVHANGRIPVQMAVKAGCHSVEHGFFMAEDNVRLMADLQTCWVPTVYTMKAYLEAIELGVVEADSSVVARTLEHQIGQLSLARKCGVKVAAGTDSGSSGVFHGASFGEELKLFIEAGYSVAETIRCAAYNGAELLGIEDEYGLILKGRPANFLAVVGDPDALSENFTNIETIYACGLPVTY